MSVTCVASPISAMPVIRPRPAVTSGIPAAISEPNVISRITSAAITPTDGGGTDVEALGLLDHLAAGGDLAARAR